MIGLIVLILIGRSYYQLAKKYDKNGFLMILAGIATYYGSAFAFGIILGLVDAIFGTNFIDGTSDVLLGLLGLPVGILGCWLVYRAIEKSWSRSAKVGVTENDIENFGTEQKDQNFEE